MNIRTALLDEMVHVRTIMTFRDKAPLYNVDGNAYAVAIKDLVSKVPSDFSHLPTIFVEEDQLNNRLLPGDVLLPGRGEHYSARHFPGAPMPVFPVGQILVLRPKPDLNSIYLAWYLNQTVAQAFVHSVLAGTGIKALTKARLASMPLPLPSAKVQETIASLQTLQETRSSMLARLGELNEREVNLACLTLLTLG